MKKYVVSMSLISFIFLFLIFFGGHYSGRAQAKPTIQDEYVPNEVLVKFKEGTGRGLIQYGIEAVQGRIKTYLKREISSVQL